jgi:hypothetical protein
MLLMLLHQRQFLVKFIHEGMRQVMMTTRAVMMMLVFQGGKSIQR